MNLQYDDDLGQGSFGEVWLAVDDAKRKVAVKFFRGSTAELEEQEAERHAQALGRVDHPAVVRLHALERQPHPDSQTERLAVVMEYVPGTVLAQHREDISASHATTIVENLVDGLEAIHAAGIVHGDFHEGNIMVSPTGAKIIDILYTHTLRDVGTRIALTQVLDDVRALATIVRGVLERNAIVRRIRNSIHECYCKAVRAQSPRDVAKEFAPILKVLSEAGAYVGGEAGALATDPKSLKWYFLNDPGTDHRIDTTMSVAIASPNGERTVELLLRCYVNFIANCRYLACYVPEDAETEQIAALLIRDTSNLLARFDGLEATYSHQSGTDPARHLSETQFTRRLLLYLERPISVTSREALYSYAHQNGVFPHIRDRSYAEMRSSLEG